MVQDMQNLACQYGFSTKPGAVRAIEEAPQDDVIQSHSEAAAEDYTRCDDTQGHWHDNSVAQAGNYGLCSQAPTSNETYEWHQIRQVSNHTKHRGRSDFQPKALACDDEVEPTLDDLCLREPNAHSVDGQPIDKLCQPNGQWSRASIPADGGSADDFMDADSMMRFGDLPQEAGLARNSVAFQNAVSQGNWAWVLTLLNDMEESGEELSTEILGLAIDVCHRCHEPGWAAVLSNQYEMMVLTSGECPA
jgi:hypothetical protein